MNLRVLLLPIMLILFGVGFSQDKLMSSKQESCDYVVKEKQVKNCTTYSNDITITIDEDKERIYIKKPYRTFIFKIVQKATVGNVISYTTIRATGTKAIIEIDSDSNQMTIIDYNNMPITTKQTFYLN